MFSRSEVGIEPLTWKASKPERWLPIPSEPSLGKRLRARDEAMEGEYFPDAMLHYGCMKGKLIGNVARFDGVAFHNDFAVTKHLLVHHGRSYDGDDDLVAANDAATGGCGEGQFVSDRTIDFRRIHRIDEPSVTFLVVLANVVMARCGGEEETFPDWKMFVAQRKAEVDTFAPGGLVRFVEDGELERIASLHSRGDDTRRLVSGEDKLHTIELGGEKCANVRAVGGDGKIQVT
jgi:hypothetical protein